MIIIYIVTIKTKFNTIRLEVEDTNSPEFVEILEQPYVEEIRVEQKIDISDKNETIKKLSIGGRKY